MVIAVVDARPPVRDEAAFDALLAAGPAPSSAPALQALVADVLRVLEAWRQADKALAVAPT